MGIFSVSFFILVFSTFSERGLIATLAATLEKMAYTKMDEAIEVAAGAGSNTYIYKFPHVAKLEEKGAALAVSIRSKGAIWVRFSYPKGAGIGQFEENVLKVVKYSFSGTLKAAERVLKNERTGFDKSGSFFLRTDIDESALGGVAQAGRTRMFKQLKAADDTGSQPKGWVGPWSEGRIKSFSNSEGNMVLQIKPQNIKDLDPATINNLLEEVYREVGDLSKRLVRLGQNKDIDWGKMQNLDPFMFLRN